MLRAAQHNARGGPDRLHLVRGDALAPPFALATFDVGLVVHLFHLVPDWRGALDQLSRAIQPGGFCLNDSERPDEAAGPDSFAPRNPFACETLGRWQRRASVRQTLGRYTSRDYSSSGSIPEPGFREANAELAAWATAHHPDPEQIIEHRFRFRVLITQRS